MKTTVLKIMSLLFMYSNHIDRNQVSDNMYHTSKPLLPAVPLQLATLATRLQPHRFTIKKDLAYLALTNDRWSLKEGKCHWYYLGYECSMFHASSTDLFANTIRQQHAFNFIVDYDNLCQVLQCIGIQREDVMAIIARMSKTVRVHPIFDCCSTSLGFRC